MPFDSFNTYNDGTPGEGYPLEHRGYDIVRGTPRVVTGEARHDDAHFSMEVGANDCVGVPDGWYHSASIGFYFTGHYHVEPDDFLMICSTRYDGTIPLFALTLSQDEHFVLMHWSLDDGLWEEVAVSPVEANIDWGGWNAIEWYHDQPGSYPPHNTSVRVWSNGALVLEVDTTAHAGPVGGPLLIGNPGGSSIATQNTNWTGLSISDLHSGYNFANSLYPWRTWWGGITGDGTYTEWGLSGSASQWVAVSGVTPVDASTDASYLYLDPTYTGERRSVFEHSPLPAEVDTILAWNLNYRPFNYPGEDPVVARSAVYEAGGVGFYLGDDLVLDNTLQVVQERGGLPGGPLTRDRFNALELGLYRAAVSAPDGVIHVAGITWEVLGTEGGGPCSTESAGYFDSFGTYPLLEERYEIVSPGPPYQPFIHEGGRTNGFHAIIPPYSMLGSSHGAYHTLSQGFVLDVGNLNLASSGNLLWLICWCTSAETPTPTRQWGLGVGLNRELLLLRWDQDAMYWDPYAITSNGFLTPNAYHWFEMFANEPNGLGETTTIRIRVDGALVYSGGLVLDGNYYWQFWFGNPNDSSIPGQNNPALLPVVIEDYVADIGDLRTTTAYPWRTYFGTARSDGATSEWSPVGALANWQCVEGEQYGPTPAWDDTYVLASGSEAGLLWDVYKFFDLPATVGRIMAVSTVYQAFGSGVFRNIYHDGNDHYLNGGDAFSGDASGRQLIGTMHGGLHFPEVAMFNSAEFGIEREPEYAVLGDIAVGEMWLEVLVCGVAVVTRQPRFPQLVGQ